MVLPDSSQWDLCDHGGRCFRCDKRNLPRLFHPRGERFPELCGRCAVKHQSEGRLEFAALRRTVGPVQ
jgi:hypothetical protein